MRKGRLWMRWVAGVLIWCLAWLPAGALGAMDPAASDALTEAARDMDRYTIVATFDPASATLRCTQQVAYTNRSGQPQPNLYFHAYANAFKRQETAPTATDAMLEATYPAGFDPGEIAFSRVAVAGREVAFALQGPAEDVLRIPVGLLEPGAQVTLDFAYTLALPRLEFRFGYSQGLYAVGNAFPIAAKTDPDGTWRLDGYSVVGDPFFSDCANYQVTLDVPEGFLVGASGALRAEETSQGRTRRTWESFAARSFALAISDGYVTARGEVDGIMVTAYATTKKRAQASLEQASQALRVFGELFAPYPFPSLNIAEIRMPWYGGMEYPGLVMIADTQFETDQGLAYVMAHEVAHEWWYAQVGSDEVREPWLDEAMSDYSTLLFFEHAYGEERFHALYQDNVEPAMRITMPSHMTVASGLDDFESVSDYGIVIYARGTGMLHGLREAVGLDTFLEIARTYLEKYRFRIATRADFIGVVNEVTGKDWNGYLDDYLDNGF